MSTLPKKIKKNQVEGVTDHIMTIAEQVKPDDFLGSGEKADLKRLMDALIRHVAGFRPVADRPATGATLPATQAVPIIKRRMLDIHRVLKWRMPYYKPGESQYLLAALVTAWVLYRYAGKLPDNFGMPRKK